MLFPFYLFLCSEWLHMAEAVTAQRVHKTDGRKEVCVWGGGLGDAGPPELVRS